MGSEVLVTVLCLLKCLFSKTLAVAWSSSETDMIRFRITMYGRKMDIYKIHCKFHKTNAACNEVDKENY